MLITLSVMRDPSPVEISLRICLSSSIESCSRYRVSDNFLKLYFTLFGVGSTIKYINYVIYNLIYALYIDMINLMGSASLKLSFHVFIERERVFKRLGFHYQSPTDGFHQVIVEPTWSHLSKRKIQN